MSFELKKIPCTIGILTLNSEGGLSACLESVKDFAEIIVCDANSTDGTREVAQKFGAKVVSQYQSNVSNIPCVKDKAFVREQNMKHAKYDWYFYLDADDTLTPEVVEEIRSIVSNLNPSHYIYRMPTRIFFEIGETLREIKHEATYPSYQTRLVHRSVGAHFRGHVHDRLGFDASKFPVGTLKGYYNFHWPEKRVANFWGYLGRYADWELETFIPGNFGNILYWGLYRRGRTILGYIFYRLPAMYIRYGFADSMPIGIELTIVRYHFKLFFGSIAKYMAKQKFWIYITEIMRGKDTNRILTNMALMDQECTGSILDIGGGKGRASHYRFLNMPTWHKITTIDISPEAKPDYVLNIENEKLPFEANSFDYVFLFNVLEHLDHRPEVLAEIQCVLKDVRSDAGRHGPDDKKGRLVGSIPFLVNVHPDPNDFVRLTIQGLQSVFKEAGFSDMKIEPVGVGPFTAGYYQFEYIIPRILRLIVGPKFMFLDFILSKIIRRSNKSRFPLSYIFSVAK